MTPRSSRAEIARRQAWIKYLMKDGYNQAQLAERFGISPSAITTDIRELEIKLPRTRAPGLPMDPVNWREEFPPDEEVKGRLARSGIIAECLALLDHLRGQEALFKLATLLEEEHLELDQIVRLRNLQGYLGDIIKAAGHPEFREQIRKDPLKYRARS